MHAYILSCFSRVQLLATLWTTARQAPLSMGFSRQEECGLPCPPPGDFPDQGMELKFLTSPALQADSLPLSHLEAPIIKVPHVNVYVVRKSKFVNEWCR